LQRHRKFEISDLRFQIEETANAEGNANGNANAKSNANADPSPLKGVRDDSLGAFFAQGKKSCADNFLPVCNATLPKFHKLNLTSANRACSIQRASSSGGGNFETEFGR